MKSLPNLISRMAPKLLDPKKGMGWADLRLLLEQWDQIVGPDYAQLATPTALRFTGDERREGTLVIAAPTPVRTELQHDSVPIIERINRLFGYTAVARLQLVPGGSLPIPEAPRNPRPPVTVSADILNDIDDPELKERLENLAKSLNTRLK